MRKFLFPLMVVLAGIMISGSTCTPDCCVPGTSVISVDKTALTYDYEGTLLGTPLTIIVTPASMTIKITGPSWFDVVAMEPSINFGGPRSGVATILAANGDMVKITITQEGVSEDPDFQEFPGDDAAWVTNRTSPSDWQFLALYQGKEDVTEMTFDETTALSARPAGQQTNYYNWQGQGIPVDNLSNSEDWIVTAEVYISAEMVNTNSDVPFAVGIWGETLQTVVPPGAPTAWPIICATNIFTDPVVPYLVGGNCMNYPSPGGKNPKWYFWDSSTGDYVEGPALTVGWHQVTIVPDVTPSPANPKKIQYYIDGVLCNEYELETTAEDAVLNQVMLLSYNFSEIAGTAPNVAQDCPGYEFKAYFANIGALVK